jgi:hypothetical protein
MWIAFCDCFKMKNSRYYFDISCSNYLIDKMQKTLLRKLGYFLHKISWWLFGMKDSILNLRFRYFPLLSALVVCIFLSVCAAVTVQQSHVPNHQFIPMISGKLTSRIQFNIYLRHWFQISRICGLFRRIDYYFFSSWNWRL